MSRIPQRTTIKVNSINYTEILNHLYYGVFDVTGGIHSVIFLSALFPLDTVVVLLSHHVLENNVNQKNQRIFSINLQL